MDRNTFKSIEKEVRDRALREHAVLCMRDAEAALRVQQFQQIPKALQKARRILDEVEEFHNEVIKQQTNET